MAGNIKGITIEIGGDTTKLEKALKSVNTTSRELNKELRDINTSLKFNPGNTELVAQKQRALGDAIENTKKKLDQLKIAQEQASAALERGDLGQDEYDALRREIIKTENQLKSLEGQANQTAQSLKGISEKFMAAGKTLNSAGDTMTKNVTVPLTALGTLSVKSAADFDSAMVGVRKTTDLTDEEFAKMGQTIRDMAKEIPATTTEIAAVAEAAGQLGISKENLVDFARVMIDLGETTNLTSDQAATSFARFANITQMPQTKMENLGSTVVALGNNFATTEAEIVAMGMRLAGTGTQVGLSEAEIMGLATAMSSVGIEAEGGGTAMSMVLNKINNALASSGAVMKDFEYVAHETGLSVEQLQNYVLGGSEGIKALAKSTGISEDALKALAKDYEKAVIPAEGFAAVVEKGGMAAEDFARKWETAPSEVLEAFVKGLAEVDKEGGNVNLTLKELGIAGVRETDTLNRLTGAADLLPDAFRMANEAFLENTALAAEAELRYKSFQAQFDVFKNKLNDVAITIGTTLLPAVTDIITGIGNFADKIAGADPKMVKLGVSIAAIAAAVGPVLKVLGGLATVIGTVTGALAVMGGATVTTTPAMLALVAVFTKLGALGALVKGAFVAIAAAVGAPVGVVVAAVAAIIAAGVLLYKNWDTVKEKATSIWGGIKEFFSNLWTGIQESWSTAWTGITTFLTELWTGFIESATPIWEGLKNVFEFIWLAIQEIFNVAWLAISTPLILAWNVLVATAQTIFLLLVEVFATIWETISGAASTAWTAISGVLTAAWEAIKTAVEPYFTAIADAISKVWESIKSKASEIWNGIKSTLEGIWNAIKTAVTPIFEAIKQAIETAWNAVKTTTETVWNTIKTALETAWNAIKTKATEVFNAVKTAIETAWNAVKTTSETIWNGIKSAVETVWNGIKTTADTVFTAIKAAIEKAWEAIKTTTTTVWEAVKKAIETPINAAKQAVESAIERMKSILNIDLPFPKIKLPHFRVTGSFSLNPPSVPSFGVDWYDKGGIFTGPTVIGVGEKRPEFVGALDDLKKIVAEVINKEGNNSGGVLVTGNTFVVRQESDIKKIAEELNKLQQKTNRARGVVTA